MLRLENKHKEELKKLEARYKGEIVGGSVCCNRNCCCTPSSPNRLPLLKGHIRKRQRLSLQWKL